MSDLSLLPPLTLASDKTLESILAEVVEQAGIEDLAPSDPAYRAALGGAYSALMAYQTMDDQMRGVMLAFAVGAQLDHIGETYYYSHPEGSPVKRLDGESDDDYRLRLRSSLDGLSVAGSVGAYQFHAKTADQTIKDVAVISPSPMVVDLYLLSRSGTGLVSSETCQGVFDYLWSRRPITDDLRVQSAVIVPYGVTAKLTISNGADESTLLASVNQSLTDYNEARRVIAGRVVSSGLHAAMMLDGVEEVALEGWSDVICSATEAPYCQAVSIEVVAYV